MKFVMILSFALFLSPAYALMSAEEMQPDMYLYSCPKDDKESLMVFNCFKSREVVDSSSHIDRSTHRYLLHNDLNTVCRCLEKDNFISREMFKGRSRADTFVEGVLSNIEAIRNRLEARKNMLVIQNDLISSNEQDLNNFNDIYAPSNLYDEVGRNLTELKTNLPSEISTQVKNRYSQELSSERLDYLKRAVEGIGFEDAALSSQKLRTISNNSCLPKHTFFLMTQLPQEKEFWSSLREAQKKGFVQDEWNYESLQKKLTAKQAQSEKTQDGVKKAGLEAEIRGIKGKLKFLYKNPIFKYTFSSTDGGAFLYLGTGVSTRQKQEELFKVLTNNLVPDNSTCWDTDNACVAEVINSPKFEEFRDLTKKIAQDPVVARIVKRETTREMENDLSQLSRRSFFNNNIPLDVNIFTQRVQYATNVNIRDCKNGQMDSELCVKGFATYCAMLRSVEDKLKTEVPPSFDDELMSEMDFNLERNDRFRELDSEYCQTARMKTPGDFFKQVTFYDYYLEKCEGGKSTDSLCKDENRVKLIAQFRTEYPHVSSSEGSSEVGSGALKDRVLTNLLTGAAQATRPMKVDDIKSSGKKYSIDEAVDLAKSVFKNSVKGLESSSQADQINASEGSLTSSIGSFMKDLAGSFKDQGTPSNGSFDSSSDFVPLLPSESAGDKSQAVTETQKLRDDAQRERDKIDDEIAETRRRLASATDDAARNSLENRIKMLEQLLAQKDKTVAEYQRLFDKLSKERAEEGAPEKAQTPRQQMASGNRVPGQNHLSQNDPLHDFQGPVANRGPASVSDRPVTTSGSASGASGSAGAAAIGGRSTASSGAMGARSLNEALLSKYGITVQGSTDGSVLVASDKEAKSLPALSASVDKSVPLDVPRSQFEKFKSNDLETLREIYEEKLKTLSGNIVKIQVTTQGEKDSLEFYAIREGNKVIFQPVRKAKLTDLKLTLPST